MSLSIYEIIIRIIISLVLGGIIGYERENTGKAAGLRTHILVCIGSTIIMISNIMIFNEFHPYTTMDPTRLGAAVISGIGFLGAGTIIREGVNIQGLTTAASIWVVGCIGLSIGSGYYFLSVFATLCIFLILKVFGYFENTRSISYGGKYQVTIKHELEFDTNKLIEYLSENKIEMLKYSSKKEEIDLYLLFDNQNIYLEFLNILSVNTNISYFNSIQIQ